MIVRVSGSGWLIRVHVVAAVEAENRDFSFLFDRG